MNEKIKHRGALPNGTRIRNFEFLQVLGHGGFGITYKAQNTVLEKTVAIKEYMPADTAIRDTDLSVHPKSDIDEKDFQWGLDRFLGEARMLARFEHPSIVQVQDFFEAKGTAYIVMEYLNGPTLSAVYDDHKVLDERHIRILLEPILDALEQIHDANFLHRDIKPSNVMFRQKDIPVLIDFGAARAAQAMRSQAMTAVVTAGYSPIEQYSTGTESKQGPWTDIYAVGATLYRGMTGIVPSDATTRIMDDRMVPVAEAVVGDFNSSLIDAVDWALQMRGSDRPQSIGEWRKVLDGGEHSPKIVSGSEPEETTNTSAKMRSTGRMKWLVSMGLVIVLAVGSGAYWWDELVEQGNIFFDRSETVDLERGVAEVRSLIEEGSLAVARSAIEELVAMGLDEVRRTELESALFEAEGERSLQDGIARVRDYIAEGNVAVARSALEELVEMGLDEVRRAELESALVAAEQGSLAKCEEQLQSGLLTEALGCCRKVLENDENNAEATACIGRVARVAWQTVDNERTVEGYYAFEQEYSDSVFAPLARVRLEELESEYWRSIQESDEVSKYLRFLEIYPESKFAPLAEIRSSLE